MHLYNDNGILKISYKKIYTLVPTSHFKAHTYLQTNRITGEMEVRESSFLTSNFAVKTQPASLCFW